jgi:hypothetical protein
MGPRREASTIWRNALAMARGTVDGADQSARVTRHLTMNYQSPSCSEHPIVPHEEKVSSTAREPMALMGATLDDNGNPFQSCSLNKYNFCMQGIGYLISSIQETQFLTFVRKTAANILAAMIM